MHRIQIVDEAVDQVVAMENSVQVLSNAGFLLSRSEPLTAQQREYSKLLDSETRKLADTFSRSFVNMGGR